LLFGRFAGLLAGGNTRAQRNCEIEYRGGAERPQSIHGLSPAELSAPCGADPVYALINDYVIIRYY